MIASARPIRFPVRSVEPRLHGIARAAVGRLASGSDRFETILAALVEATSAQALPSCYDHLSPLQRKVVLAMWGNGPTRLRDVTEAMPGRRRTVVWRVAMDLWRIGVLLKVSRGIYVINPDSPTLRPRTGCRALDATLVQVLGEIGETALRDLARRFGVHAKTMHRRLEPLLASGEAIRVREGVYALAEVA